MFTQRYASTLTVLVIILLCIIGVLGSNAMDWHRAAREAQAEVDARTQELKAIGRFDTVCMNASGKLVITLAEHSTHKLDLACMRGAVTLFSSNPEQMQ